MNRLSPTLLRASCACAALLLAATGGVAAVPLSPALQAIEERALDEPRAALQLGAQRVAASRAAADRDTEFWLHLGLASVHVQTDDEAGAALALAAAEALVPAGSAGQRQRLWVEVQRAMAAASPTDLRSFRVEQTARRQAAQALGDEPLLCRIATLDAAVYNDQFAANETWAALEAVEACGRRLGDVATQAYALSTLGLLAARVNRQQPPQTYFDRAMQVLGERPSRFQRAWLLDDLAWARLDQGSLPQARAAFEESLALSQELGDVSGRMRGHEGLAEVLLKLGDAAGSLRQARQALRLADTQGLVSRRVTAQTQIVEASALLRTPDLLAEIQTLRAMPPHDAAPRAGALVAATAARGYRALGLHAQAYTELERYLDLMSVHEKAHRDSLTQQLQARYEAAQRDAEVSALRQREESSRLELAARRDRLRALWAVVAALLVVLAGGAWFFARALRRRRRLADLALRDELTGLPNRRAVLAFAHEQFNLARRLSLPIAVAVIDLDRFKQVNDSFGHACGDRVLQAFADAATQVLRGQDRIGRYGGEEWLVVMPGTQADELAPLFKRLRERLALQHIHGMPQPHGVSFSMGGAQLLPGIDNLEALIAEADAQLYRAKAHGRDALCSASDGVVRSAPGALAAAN